MYSNIACRNAAYAIVNKNMSWSLQRDRATLYHSHDKPQLQLEDGRRRPSVDVGALPSPISWLDIVKSIISRLFLDLVALTLGCVM